MAGTEQTELTRLAEPPARPTRAGPAAARGNSARRLGEADVDPGFAARLSHLLRGPDPGLLRATQAGKTLLAIVVMIAVYRTAGVQTRLFAAVGAAFVIQCTSGGSVRRKMTTMLAAGAAMTCVVAVGAAVAPHHWLRNGLIVAVAWLALDARRHLPNKDLFPVFGFTLCLLSVALPSAGWGTAWREVVAVGSAVPVAFLTYFFVLRPGPVRAAEDAVRLFCDRAADVLGVEAGAPRLSPRDVDRRMTALRAAPAFVQKTTDDHPGHPAGERLTALVPELYEILESLLVIEWATEEEAARLAVRGRLDAAASALRSVAKWSDAPPVASTSNGDLPAHHAPPASRDSARTLTAEAAIDRLDQARTRLATFLDGREVRR